VSFRLPSSDSFENWYCNKEEKCFSVMRTWLRSLLSRVFNRTSERFFWFAVSWSFMAWTINILYEWKFKYSFNIRRTVRSDVLNAMTFLFAYFRGILKKALRNRSMISGVLSGSSLSRDFLFTANVVSLQFLTHNSKVLRHETLSFRWILKCRRNFRGATTTESFFQKNVYTSKARCCTDQRSVATACLESH
jgi:hypothetical protein